MTSDVQQQQVKGNYEAFLRELPKLIQAHRNKYALMRNGEIVNLYSTLEDAYVTAAKFYPDGVYSVQLVTDVPVDLGFYSHAVHLR